MEIGARDAIALDHPWVYIDLSIQIAIISNAFEFEVEMIVTCVRNGFTLDWVPIRTIYAGEESHIHPWHDTVRFLRVVWRTRRSLQREIEW